MNLIIYPYSAGRKSRHVL